MAIKTQYKVLDEIPQTLREHAVQVDGSYIVEVDDIETHPAVNKLRNAYAKEKERRDAQAQAIADLKVKLENIPEDFDPDKWSQLKVLENTSVDPEKQREAIKKELDAQRLSIKENLERKHDTEKRALLEETAKLKGFLEKTVKQDRLREGLVTAGVAKEFLAGAMALLQDRIKVVYDESKDAFIDVVETDMGDINAKEYAVQWVQKDEGKPYVKPASGPELNPKNRHHIAGDNPWAAGQINLTKQTQILMSDGGKEKAARLMAAAGVK